MSEEFPTLLISTIFLSNVNLFLFFKVTVILKGFPMLITSIGLVFSVDYFMSSKDSGICEGFPT
jgi:hypothetical protein